MTIRNLDYLFKPRSVALIGASRQSNSVGAVLARNLLTSGFEGPVMPVNPKYRAIEGVLTYPDIDALPVTPDLAVISTPARSVPDIVAKLGERGSKAAIVIAAGLGEPGEDGRTLQEAMLEAARPHMLRLLGPNCLGTLVPGIGLNASFAHLSPRRGRLAFIAQSGAIVTSVLDWAESRGIGFSHLVSLGDMADVDFGDMLDYLANDPGTSAILLYIEAVTHARKFISAARAAARMKPVIAVKAGRHAEGARAAASHTGALAGHDKVYDAVFRRTGVLRVLGLDELFTVVEMLATTRAPKGERLAILTNGGGIGVLATDALADCGGRLAELAPETVERLDRVLPPIWPRGNPVDIIGDAPPARYRDSLGILLEDRGVDAVLVLNCPTAVGSSTEAARAVIEARGARTEPPVLSSWVGGDTAEPARRLFAQHRTPSFDTPEKAARAFMYLVDYRRRQELLIETPPSAPTDFSPDPARAREIAESAMADGRQWLSEPEAKQVLAAYGVPVVKVEIAADPEEAAAIAGEHDGPVVIKIMSPDILHKSDVGGVALDIRGPAAARETAQTMLDRLRHSHPAARLLGFSVEPMVRRRDSYELIVGVTEDPQFGPVILFGQGGTAVEVIKDQALGLPPLNMRLAHEVISRTRIYGLLQGYRGLPPANLEAVALTLIRISQLIVDLPEIVELDVNPLVADPHGVIALDARMRVRPAEPGLERLAIRPYPKGLEEHVPLANGRTLLLRPIRPEDEPSLHAAFAKLSPEEIRLRFFVPMKTLSHVAAARFTQLDYDREMALVLTEAGIPGHTEIYGLVSLSSDPDNVRGEFAILVRGDMTGMGLGIMLMRRIIDYAKARGIMEIEGDVLRENTTMLKLARVLGFTEHNVPDEQNLVRVKLRL